MYRFPDNLFTDVRIEQVTKTEMVLLDGVLKQNKKKTDKGAMIRVFDGKRWYYSATTDITGIQAEIDKLAAVAEPNENIYENPVIKALEVNNGDFRTFTDKDVSKVSLNEKLALMDYYKPLITELKEMQTYRVIYLDNHTEKHILSSKGTDITFDTQICNLCLRYVINVNDLPKNCSADICKTYFEDLKNKENILKEEINKDLNYAYTAVPVEPGIYTCILSPETAGVFAHESFGHKSEADFMVGDETMMREWAIGSRVGSEILNIIDTGTLPGTGYVPFDDEGNKARYNYLIKDGILTGRLHSAYTAAALNEDITANARSISFEYEPIVRMTNTFIGSGSLTKDELFAGVKRGIYIENIKHGSGMSTFTIAPDRAYLIEDGKITTPLKVAVITGNVMKTLNEIDGASDEVEYLSFAIGGCGKMEQYPLRVGFGGPYVRVNNINVG